MAETGGKEGKRALPSANIQKRFAALQWEYMSHHMNRLAHSQIFDCFDKFKNKVILNCMSTLLSLLAIVAIYRLYLLNNMTVLFIAVGFWYLCRVVRGLLFWRKTLRFRGSTVRP